MAWGEFRSSRYLRGKVKPYNSIGELNYMLDSLAKQIDGKLKVFITSSNCVADLVSDGREF